MIVMKIESAKCRYPRKSNSEKISHYTVISLVINKINGKLL